MAPMDFASIPLFEAITRRMGWLTQRQTVLAENVANVNTPGYNEKDLKEPDFSGILKGAASAVHMVATNPNHITTRPDGQIDGTVVTTEDRTLNGNGVSIEAQMMKVSDNSADYTLTTTLYKKHIALIKMALGGGSGG
jgi:flagellar basal-body rod protein FlgB